MPRPRERSPRVHELASAYASSEPTVSPQVRRVAEVFPPAVLALAALLFAADIARDRFDVQLAQIVGLLVLFELVTSLVETLLVERFGDPRVGRAIGFVAASAAIVAAAAAIAREWPQSGLAPLGLVLALVVLRFAACVADPARDELARLRAAALANDRLDSVRVMIGVLPFLALPWLAAAYLGAVDSLRPASVAPGLFAAAWALLLVAAAWHAGSSAFARRAQRLFVRDPWPWLTDWYEPPSRRQSWRADRKAELRAARRYERSVSAAEKRASGRLAPPSSR